MEERMPEEIYDVVVLGGGAGGVAAAIRAAQLGGKVAVIEADTMGGLCMNRGCIPFGHMMVAANILGNLPLAKAMGLEFTGVRKDYKVLIERQNELINFMRLGLRSTLIKNGVKIIEGKGRVTGKGKLEVNGTIIFYKNLILATGAKWLEPDFPGSDLDEVISSDDLLRSEKLPERVLLCGRDPWTLKIAQFLHRYGSQVIVVTEEKRILSEESKTIASRLARALKEEGISILTRTQIAALEKSEEGLHCVLKVKEREKTFAIDQVIYLKRSASLEGLGLETVGLDEKRSYIETDERMKTDVDGVFAIGDVAAPETRHYSHLASSGGIVAAENAMGMDSIFDRRAIARVVFTQPQIACVGLTAREAKEAGYQVLVGTAPLSMNPFGMVISQNEGIVEVVAEKEYGEVLGIHLIGEGACEMAAQAVLAIQLEVSLEELARALYPHPTLSESVAEAARECLGWSIYLP
jgi:dihydrolipoamide dehydrogenase